ncbi:MAG: DUF302 domain-containing protein [Deltaproteobacteria bacterium]|nr:MAG: DUF302 domain-containing protein [Deltaproteobacteria bacterium]
MSIPALKKDLNCTYEEALARVPEALAAEGFGILTEIDVRETLKKKLDVDFRRYKILGACNPPLAHRALNTDLDVGVLLPCNVVVYENDAGKASISAMDPVGAIGAFGGAQLQELAREVRAKLDRALESLA